MRKSAEYPEIRLKDVEKISIFGEIVSRCFMDHEDGAFYDYITVLHGLHSTSYYCNVNYREKNKLSSSIYTEKKGIE
jgi:hypothetical protein